jgi:anti-sigma regulatory factor (Ser/Thr protein kinase)
VEYERELPRSKEAPQIARRAVIEWYGDSLEADELENTKIVVSELVTNAVTHGVGRIRFRAHSDDDRILVEVLDEGSGFEYEAGQVPFDQLRGRGLEIVEAASSRWGIHEGTMHVWAEIEREGPRLGENKKPEP